MKNYRPWLKTAAIIQLLTAIIHATTLFVSAEPANETEKQLFGLMDTYRLDLGAGFHKTMGELVLSLSACLTLLCLLGGLLNWYLLRKQVTPDIMKGVININLLVFSTGLVIFTLNAFLVPIVLVGLIVLLLLIASITIPKKP